MLLSANAINHYVGYDGVGKLPENHPYWYLQHNPIKSPIKSPNNHNTQQANNTNSYKSPLQTQLNNNATPPTRLSPTPFLPLGLYKQLQQQSPPFDEDSIGDQCDRNVDDYKGDKVHYLPRLEPKQQNLHQQQPKHHHQQQQQQPKLLCDKLTNTCISLTNSTPSEFSASSSNPSTPRPTPVTIICNNGLQSQPQQLSNIYHPHQTNRPSPSQ